MAFMINGQIRVTPYVIPHSANMPQAMVKSLTKTHSQVIKLKSQIVVSKALGSYASMREMVASEKALVSAGTPIKKTRHGKIIPATPTVKILATQTGVLTDAQRQATTIGTGYLEKTARTDILTGKVEGLFGEIAGLKQELRDAKAPIVQKSIFGDLGLPSLGDLKGPLIIGALGLGAILILPKLIGAFKK